MDSQSEAKPPTGSVDGNLAIGIDLGTCKCCVGVVRDGKVEIIENERGSKTTPSYVAFTGTERLVGEDARLQATVNCANTVFGVKRIIGRSFDDSSLQNDVNAVFPFTVGNDNGKPVVEVTYRGEKKHLFPEQVSAMLLVKMKRIAESHLGCQVRDAVISVPAYFNNAQRQATKDAGTIAGLNVLGLINEPTAAALAYRNNKGLTDETICIVDLGGGTLDVSVIQLGRDGQVQVKKNSGNSSFGGIDFDVCLVRHFLADYAAKTGQNIDGNKKAVLRLQIACEKLKNTLSLLRSGQIQLDCLVGDTDYESSISQDNFNSLTADLLDKRLIAVLSELLQDSEAQIPLSISRVILIGGSTRIPKVQQILQHFFNGKKLDQSVNPDEAIAHGAAIYASDLRAGKDSMQEVYPHAIILTTGENQELPLLAANTPVARREYMSLEGPNLSNQLSFFTEKQCLASSDRYKTTDLGVIDATNKDLTMFGLVYGFDKDGLFVTELLKKCDDQLLYVQKSDVVDLMKNEERQFEKDENKEKERLKALNYVEGFCSRNKAKARNMREVPDLRVACETFMNECDDAMTWFDEHPDATKADCKEKLRKLDQKIKILSTLVSKGNYPDDYLTYEGHPYLLDEASSDESAPEGVEDRRPERDSKKGKKTFYSAPTKRTKSRASLFSMTRPVPSTKDTDSEASMEEKDAWKENPQKGKRSRRSSSKAKSGSKFYSAQTNKIKTRSPVKGHFDCNDEEEDSTKGVGSREMGRPPGGNKNRSSQKKKSKCTLM